MATSTQTQKWPKVHVKTVMSKDETFALEK